jgi:hypothetical protein
MIWTRLAIAAAMVLVVAVTAAADDELFYSPSPSDLNDLPHGKYFTWGIDVSEIGNRQILEVELFVNNITNHNNGENVLYIHHMDDADLGVNEFNDNQSLFVDDLDGTGPLVDEFHDTNGSSTREDLHYVYSALGILDDFQADAVDDTVAVGMDPDCHFWNHGVCLKITVESTNATESSSWGQVKDRFKQD